MQIHHLLFGKLQIAAATMWTYVDHVRVQLLSSSGHAPHAPIPGTCREPTSRGVNPGISGVIPADI